MSPFLPCRRVSLFSWLLLGLGLSLHFYRVRELLICWLFFSLALVSLGSVIAGGMLAWYVGERAFHWARAFAQAAPGILSARVELHRKAVTVSRRWK